MMALRTILDFLLLSFFVIVVARGVYALVYILNGHSAGRAETLIILFIDTCVDLGALLVLALARSFL